MNRRDDLLKYVLRFSLVGAINTVLYIVLLYLCLTYLVVPRPYAVGAAFILCMLFQYIANRRFTFGSSEKLRTEILRYLASAAISYLLSLVGVMILHDGLALNMFITSILVGIVVAASSFVISLMYVYRKA